VVTRVGKYELIARLGKGGMAHVHLAVVRGLGGFNKLVVLKRLESNDDAFRTMFLDEAKLAALLHHSNVIDTYEVSETDGAYFIAMEYLDGQPLDKIIREMRKLERPLEPRLCVRIVADALSGLHYVHELHDYGGAPLNVVHRDISPHNLFLTYEGTVKVLDFGVAKTNVKVAQTEVGTLKGKLAYMAPEQAAGEPVDRRADLFAIGAVLWELLTLARLRRGESAADVLNEALYGVAPDLTKARPGVNSRLDSLVAKALARAPRRRFQTAQEMRDALLDYLAATPCSQEELGDFMRQHFGVLRDSMQRQIAACLRGAEQQDPVISVINEEEQNSLLLREVNLEERSLPTLDSGSLPQGADEPHERDDLTTPLAPESMLQSRPPSVEHSVTSRSRSIAFTHETPEPNGKRGRLLRAALVVAAAGLAWVLLRKPTSEPTAPLLSEALSTAPTPVSPPSKADVLLRLHGSNTIGQELAPRLAEAFLRKRGFASLERKISGEHNQVLGRDPLDGKQRTIEVLAQGSSTAFSDLASSNCDVGLSSRRIKPTESEALREKGLGDLESAAGEHVLGMDGIAVIVHPNSPLQRLDLPTLKRVFTGEVSDLDEVGGGTGPIHLYVRDERSGTFDTFRHLVMGDAPVAASATRYADSAELSGAVARDPAGIGFIGIPYVRSARALAIGEQGAATLFPSAFTVGTEGYALSRRLYLYLPVQNVKPLALEFVDFALSSEGQEVVKAGGFVDLSLHASELGECPRCPARYAALARNAKRLSLDFRFRTGSAELDNRALRDLDRIVAYMRDTNQSRITLVGFSDSLGSAAQNLKLSQERAKKVADELQARGVRSPALEAMGHELPVASNNSENGREKNRRVEVWLR
jgi:phosphate transport system substrate-binding protein